MTEPVLHQNFVLVLMPFHPDFDDVYHLGIKAAVPEELARCERIDEQKYLGNILERIYSQIRQADVVISDTSTPNPNVYYEVGYAHALGKPVILLTREGGEIPFDLRGFNHIIYRKIGDLKNELEKLVRWFFESPQQIGPDDNSGTPNLKGPWLSIWTVEENGVMVPKREVFHIDRQRGRAFSGKVVSQEKDQEYCECDLDGVFSDGYLQIRWSTSKNSADKDNADRIDHGCYFLERQSNGSYKGYAVGYFWNLGRVGTYAQEVRRLKSTDQIH